MINLGDQYFESASNRKGSESIRLYIKAATEYSLVNQKYKSGLAYQKAAEIFFNSDLKYQAAINYIKASTQYNGVDNSRAICSLTLAINLLTITKHLRLATTNLELLGTLNIKEHKLLEAINCYEQAYKNYKTLRMEKESFVCFRKISNIMIQNEDYERALLHLKKKDCQNIKIFFDIAILLFYINGSISCFEFLSSKNNLMLTKEYFLLNDLIIAFDNNDKIKFQNLINVRKNILLKWHSELLIKISESI